MAFERRTRERRNLSYYLPVTDASASRPRGVMLDVSLTGFRLESREPVPSGLVERFRLSLTSDIAPGAFLLFLGRSKWCRQDYIDPSLYNIGYEFINLSQEHARVLQRILEKYGSTSNNGNKSDFDRLWR